MIAAVCNEIGTDNETATLRHIINGLEGNESWENFRTSWKMIPATVRPKTIDELERLMAEHARDNKPSNEWQTNSRTRWKFPREQKTRGRGGWKNR